MFIKDGNYKGLEFQIRLSIPENYPNEIVKVYFETKVIHPMINFETGELNIQMLSNLLKFDYEKFRNFSSNKIEKLLLYIQTFLTNSRDLEILNSLNSSSQNKYFV